MAYRRDLIALLAAEPRTASSLARQLGLRRGDIEEEVRHALRSAVAAGHRLIVEPARCKACDFRFDTSTLTKPGRCPACKGSRIFEPLLRIQST